jgi:DNA polymerase-3 subunit delta
VNVSEFLRGIERGRIAPVYFFTGDEPFLIQSALARLLDRTVEPSGRDFNYVQIDGKGAEAERVLNEAQSLPVFSERRLVVLRNAEAMNAAESKLLTGYLKDPSPTTCLAVIAVKPDSRRAFFQELSRNHPVVECRPLPEGLLPDWIRNAAGEWGYAVSDEAVTFLIEQVGSDLFRLRNEILKAGLAAGGSKAIGRTEIQRVCGTGGQWSIPDLLENVGERRTEQALRVLKGLLEAGEAPLLILSALARQFRQVLRIRELLQRNLPEGAIQKRLNVWRSVWPRLSRQAKASGMEDLLWSLKRVAETDAGLKGAAAPNGLILETLVMDLCSGRGKSLRRFLGGQDFIYL